MTRSIYSLAALASSAVAGLDPAAVASLGLAAGAPFAAALIEDDQGRRWIVRAPLTAGAGAELEAAAAVTTLLGRRLPVSVPTVRGFVSLPEGGRAAVHAALPGKPLDLSGLRPDDALTGNIGRLIASIHNLDPALFDQAGLENYTSEEYRERRLADLDRAAATGRVPASLLSRWEHGLENTALWRFAPTPIHGGLSGRHLLVTVSDDGSAAAIRGVLGWRRAKVADPADDFAAIVRDCSPETTTALARAYVHGRAVRPDRHMLDRAHLVAELRYVSALVEAMAVGYPQHVEAETERLRQLEESLAEAEKAPPGVPESATQPIPEARALAETTAAPMVSTSATAAAAAIVVDSPGAEAAPTGVADLDADVEPHASAAPEEADADTEHDDERDDDVERDEAEPVEHEPEEDDEQDEADELEPDEHEPDEDDEQDEADELDDELDQNEDEPEADGEFEDDEADELDEYLEFDDEAEPKNDDETDDDETNDDVDEFLEFDDEAQDSPAGESEASPEDGPKTAAPAKPKAARKAKSKAKNRAKAKSTHQAGTDPREGAEAAQRSLWDEIQ